MAHNSILSFIFMLCLIISCNFQEKDHESQTDYNIRMYENYEKELQQLNIQYAKLINKYEDCCEYENDLEWLNYNKTVLKHLKQSHQAWEISLEKQDALIIGIYDRGTMRGGVLNQNRVDQIKSRKKLYKQLE